MSRRLSIIRKNKIKFETHEINCHKPFRGIDWHLTVVIRRMMVCPFLEGTMACLYSISQSETVVQGFQPRVHVPLRVHLSI